MTYTVIVIVALIGYLIALAWLYRWEAKQKAIVEKTIDQRRRIYDAVGYATRRSNYALDYEALWEMLDTVSAKEHMDALRRGDDPLQLYATDIQTLMLRKKLDPGLRTLN